MTDEECIILLMWIMAADYASTVAYHEDDDELDG